MTVALPPQVVPAFRWAWTALGLFLILVSLLSCAGHPLRGDRPRGVYHQVKAGENLTAIARAYRVALQDLAEINNISNPDQIEAGSVIFVPDATQIVDIVPPVARAAETAAPKPAAAPPKPKPPPADPTGSLPGERVADRAAPSRDAAAGETAAKDRMPPLRESQKGEVPGKAAATPIVAPPLPPTPEKRGDEKRQGLTFDKTRFIWPVQGKVISQFGMQPNRMYFNGIRIAAPGGTAVLAAADGTVIFSASLKDYGETIIIKHADQYATVYSHLGTRTVRGETRVKRGDRIAFLDDAGQGEVFVHFEIRQNNKARNPLFLLP
jgi:lipoprotein NlpD